VLAALDLAQVGIRDTRQIRELAQREPGDAALRAQELSERLARALLARSRRRRLVALLPARPGFRSGVFRVDGVLSNGRSRIGGAPIRPAAFEQRQRLS
jgi:hypothetical protein